MKNIIFISKDALNKHALPIYGNKYWETPNINALASKGTIFHRHYTAAASTAMAFTAMALGKYCFQTNRKEYKNETSLNGNTIFDQLYRDNYECHIVWDDSYTEFAKSHFKCEGENTIIHSLNSIKQVESAHIKGVFDDVSRDDAETKKAVDIITKELKDILSKSNKKIFLWMHLPHVMRGRQGYGSDIDVFDEIIGIAREIYGDECIFISADHGHMNGWKNKYHYGYDTGEEAICIPLITPRINNQSEINFPTSTLQMYQIFKKENIEKLEYVLCETAYYAQPKRKIAIIKDNYKYCYDKENKKEELYDLVFDKEEKHNLVYPEFYDVDRFLWYSTAQCFYYPSWDKAHAALIELRKQKDLMWKKGTFIEEFKNKILHRVKCLYKKFKLRHPSKNIRNIGK